MAITINQQSDLSSSLSTLAAFRVKKLECSLTQQTFVTNVQLSLSSIAVEQNRTGEIISIVSTPSEDKGDDYLFKVLFTQVSVFNFFFNGLYASFFL